MIEITVFPRWKVFRSQFSSSRDFQRDSQIFDEELQFQLSNAGFRFQGHLRAPQDQPVHLLLKSAAQKVKEKRSFLCLKNSGLRGQR